MTNQERREGGTSTGTWRPNQHVTGELLNQERKKPEEKGNKNTKTAVGSHKDDNIQEIATLRELQPPSNPQVPHVGQQGSEDKTTFVGPVPYTQFRIPINTKKKTKN